MEAGALSAPELKFYLKINKMPQKQWRKGWDSNPRWACTHGGFQDRCLKPLGHPSGERSMPVDEAICKRKMQASASKGEGAALMREL